MHTAHVARNCVAELSLASGRSYDDPSNQVRVDISFTSPDGKQTTLPAFWSGANVWRFRYASPHLGTHRFRTICSDESNTDLHDRSGRIEVTAYEGDNPLYRHGPLRVSESRRHFEHLDATPFFWLADTWWMGLCSRLRWPGDFHALTQDRVDKGFNVVQVVAGLYPDMPPFDERGVNEAGFPWEPDYARINPAYFDMADLRIDYLVRRGLVPCIVGCWGYFLRWMGIEKAKQHWRNLVARYAAYPVVWCLAGEAVLPFYLSEQREQDTVWQRDGWTQLVEYVRGIDPFSRPVTIHPTDNSRAQINDPSLLDLDMLQTGHEDRQSVAPTVEAVRASYDAMPRLPVVNSEVCYEGIGDCCRQDVQRFMFWACFLSGACGHTYGANGLWQVNTADRPYGVSPHGMSWGDTTWEQASQLPGSTHLGIAKRLLERYEWWRFEPHPEWVEPHAGTGDYFQPYAAGIPGRLRIVFYPFFTVGATLTEIEADVDYRAFLFNPVNGDEHALDRADPDDRGRWTPQMGTGHLPHQRPPVYQDWILVMEAQAGAT